MRFNVVILKRLSAGALVGAVNGLFGGGGGMIAVPVLTGLLSYDEKRAHATAIFIIAPVCAVSAAVYIIRGFFCAELVIPVALGSVAGGLLGANLLNRLPAAVIDGVFIAVMLAAGVRMAL